MFWWTWSRGHFIRSGLSKHFICKSNSILFSLHFFVVPPLLACIYPGGPPHMRKGVTWKLIINVPFLWKSKQTFHFFAAYLPSIQIPEKVNWVNSVWNIQRLSTIERNFVSWSAFTTFALPMLEGLLSLAPLLFYLHHHVQ